MTPVIDKVAKTARACAYSRAGILWSDPHPGRFARGGHAGPACGAGGDGRIVAHSQGGLTT